MFLEEHDQLRSGLRFVRSPHRSRWQDVLIGNLKENIDALRSLSKKGLTRLEQEIRASGNDSSAVSSSPSSSTTDEKAEKTTR